MERKRKNGGDFGKFINNGIMGKYSCHSGIGSAPICKEEFPSDHEPSLDESGAPLEMMNYACGKGFG